MSTRITEFAFENAIENVLKNSDGWKDVSASEWDVTDALFPKIVLDFIESTQPDEWRTLQKLHGEQTGARVIEGLRRTLDREGTIRVLRNGFKYRGTRLHVAYFKPAVNFSEELMRRYIRNQLTITRQVKFDPRTDHTVDLIVTLNGVPVATAELKNPATGQNYHSAINQYKRTRNPKAPLFQFGKRALVHFAVDPNEVWMTTCVAKDETQFIPFNRGSKPGESDCGSGNPKTTKGYASSYLWEEVLQRDSLLEILGSFVFEKKEKLGSGRKNSIIFPRYHQLDALRKLIAASVDNGPGHNYLVQHSAGSGKTNTISWLAHRLSSLHTDKNQKIYDCVLVITDRRVLDRQLQEAVWEIDHKRGVVEVIDKDSQQLTNALVDGTKIVVTTLQKFPFVFKQIAGNTETTDSKNRKILAQIASRSYAIIVDEAHSSQSGDSAAELRKLLGLHAIEYAKIEDPTWEDGLNYAMESRRQQQNLSFYAFTATPKGKTLQLFGESDANGVYRPTHLYTMRQAIEEHFILNVLENYTTYETYYHLLKIVEDNPNLPERKAAVKLTKYATLHPANIAQKTEIIIEHFRLNVLVRLQNRAKAMVVTNSREAAVRYKLAFEDYLEQQKYTNIKVLVAFSGTVRVGGKQYTEPAMNLDVKTNKPVSEARLPSRFASEDYQVLLAADKYQVGFDQPLLCAMYIDKKLGGIQAVQTLSRLNRTYLGKDAPFVLDFVNDMNSIREAFLPFYGETLLPEPADPERLEELKYQLDDANVYHWEDIEDYAKIWFAGSKHHTPTDHQKLNPLLQKAVARYRDMEADQEREKFLATLIAYIRAYAFLSQVMHYPDTDHEKLYAYGRPLARMLSLPNDSELIDINDDVALQYLRIEQISSGAIDLNGGEINAVRAPVETGMSRGNESREFLSSIIEELNREHGFNFTENDLLIFEQVKADALIDEAIVQKAGANPLLEDFKTGVREAVKGMVMTRHSENDSIVTRYLEDEDFQRIVFNLLAQRLFTTLRQEDQDR